ncbi:transient receptor potential cation channel subfamily V member 1-like [Arapaima gigas]
MSKRNATETTPFSLEMDDRSDDETFQNRENKKGPFATPFSLVNTGQERTPMDVGYLDEVGNTTPKIKFNLNFDKKLKASEGHKVEETVKKFGIKSLFAAVSSRDVSQLQGLELYLRRTMKHLTNSEYQSNGKNALLKALLNLKDGRNDTIEFLLDLAEKMGDLKEFVNAAYTDSYYKGHTALHVAIERRSRYFIKLLIQKGADVHAKACGKFFQPHDEPSFYFGRLLHALVLVADNSRENTDFINSMYDHILTRAARLYPETRLEDSENKEGLTPLKLAAKTGKIGLFRNMIQREFHAQDIRHLSRKFTEWVYGPVQSSLYDLASVDSYEKNSVMEIIVYDSTIPNRPEMLQIELLNKLLNDKWDRFAKWIFLFNFISYILYLIIFTVIAYYRQEEQVPFPVENTGMGRLYVAGQGVSALGAAYFFFKGILGLRRKRLTLQMLFVDGYSEILFFIQAVLFTVTSVLYFCGMQEYLCFLVLCLSLSWINILYFLRGSRLMGIYNVMIQQMIFSDVLRFLFVYIVYLLGFSAAIVTLIDDSFNNTTNSSSDCRKPSFNDFRFTTLELFKFTIGMGDLEFTDQYQYKEVFYLLLISYIVLTYILLLNMLIALMNKTVERLSEESTNVWKLQRAVTILDLERSLPSFLRRRFRSGLEKQLCRGHGANKRWCFSVEEVNWTKWSNDMSIINEDPGDHSFPSSSSLPDRSPRRGRSWRQLLRRSLAGHAQDFEMTPIRDSRNPY